MKEAIAPWALRQGQIARVSAVWFHAGVAHFWQAEAEWLAAYHEAADAAVAAAQEVAHHDRTLRWEAVAAQIHTFAGELAHDPRFPAARSKDKRAFMVRQLFAEALTAIGEEIDPDAAAQRIAERAMLIHWWETVDGPPLAERVHTLAAQGESMRSIAALLGVSEAKVRAALADDQQ